jgi:hypothetical protein
MSGSSDFAIAQRREADEAAARRAQEPPAPPDDRPLGFEILNSPPYDPDWGKQPEAWWEARRVAAEQRNAAAKTRREARRKGS